MSLAWSSCTSSTKTCSVQDATLLGAVKERRHACLGLARAPRRGDERLGRLNNLRTGAARTVQQQSGARRSPPIALLVFGSSWLHEKRNDHVLCCYQSNPGRHHRTPDQR
jgi:hypothetical protein